MLFPLEVLRKILREAHSGILYVFEGVLHEVFQAISVPMFTNVVERGLYIHEDTACYEGGHTHWACFLYIYILLSKIKTHQFLTSRMYRLYMRTTDHGIGAWTRKSSISASEWIVLK
jgi:hypothetical protein